MPFCENCGNLVSDTAKFCSNCGEKIKKPGETLNHTDVVVTIHNTKDDAPTATGLSEVNENTVKPDPADPEEFCKYLDDKIEAKEYQTVLEDCNSAIIIHPAFPRFYNCRGRAKYMLESYKAAVEDYNKAIEIEPGKSGFYFNRGLAKYMLHSYKAAVEDFSKAIEIDPEEPDYYYNRGLAKYMLDSYKAAVEDFSKAIEIDPGNPEYYYWRGSTKWLLNQSKSAVEDLTKAIEIDPGNENYYISRGRTYHYSEPMSKTSLSMAMQDFLKALKINSESYDGYYRRGLLKYDLNDWKGALSDLSKAIEIKPDNDGYPYYYRGMAKEETDDSEGAAEDFSKAFELGVEEAYDHM